MHGILGVSPLGTPLAFYFVTLLANMSLLKYKRARYKSVLG